MASENNSVEKSMETMVLITRLDDALKQFDMPVWKELRSALTTTEPPEPESEPSGEWYQANPSLMVREKRVLETLMMPLPNTPTLFNIRQGSKCLGAIGLVQLTGGIKVKLEILFPEDYPDSPPRAFYFGPGLMQMADRLTPNGAVPVPYGADQRWTQAANSGHILAWAIEWLERNAQLRRLPSSNL